MDDLGFVEVIDNGKNELMISGFMPISSLASLDNFDECINFARPIYRPLVNKGIVTTLGDVAQRSDFVRDGFGVSGVGSKIGVISDSYDRDTNNGPSTLDMANGDLPNEGVDILFDGEFIPGASDEGRAMLQIIHDIAPGAQLAFKTGFISAGSFAASIIDLADANCDIIVDDVTYITEPFFKDGLVAQAVDEVTARGVTYVSAAGNYGDNAYDGVFNPAPAPLGIPGLAHDFGGGDVMQSITLKPGKYTFSLQWVDDFYSIGETENGGAHIDLDIYMIDDDGTVRYNRNYNNLGGDPLEVMDFEVKDVETTTNLMVVNAFGSQAVRFKYVIFRGTGITFNEFEQGTSTIVGQANAAGAIAVGAVLYLNTPPFGVAVPTPASFSSRGGTLINGQSRNKPDICAPNGVNTTVDLGGVGDQIDGDEFPNFSGTSAAAPHVAASIALIKEARQKFLGLATTPQDARDLLISTALDM